jgi:hypothetical protein
MNRFIEGADRTQSTLLPEMLDEYIAETNPVRVVDVYVDELDLALTTCRRALTALPIACGFAAKLLSTRSAPSSHGWEAPIS